MVDYFAGMCLCSALLIFSLLMLHEFNEPSPHINLNGERRHKFGFVTNIPAEFFIRCLRITKMIETENLDDQNFSYNFSVLLLIMSQGRRKVPACLQI